MWQGEHETTQEVKARLAAATLSQIFGTFDMIWDYDDMIILYDVISYDMVWYDQQIYMIYVIFMADMMRNASASIYPFYPFLIVLKLPCSAEQSPILPDTACIN